MFHGQKDDVVPVSFSKKVLSVFTKAKKWLLLKMVITVYHKRKI